MNETTQKPAKKEASIHEKGPDGQEQAKWVYLIKIKDAHIRRGWLWVEVGQVLSHRCCAGCQAQGAGFYPAKCNTLGPIPMELAWKLLGI